MVDKPAGVVVHPARGHRTGTLAQALAGQAAGGEDAARAGLVHRLDRDTSGLLVVARTEAVHRALRAALQARAITREYLALVEGRPPARTGTIDAPLGRDRRVRTRLSTDTDDPRAAVTHFAIERALPRTTLLRVRLETGRTHQIRAHLQAIGHPVAGDPEYGTPGRSASSASSCTPRAWRSRTRSRARPSTSARRCRPTCGRRWTGPPPSDRQLRAVGDVDDADVVALEDRPQLAEDRRAAGGRQRGDERHRLVVGDRRLAVGAVHEGDARSTSGSKRRMAVEAGGPRRRGRRGWSEARRSRSSTSPDSTTHGGGSAPGSVQRGMLTLVTTPPPGRSTRASSSAARGPSNQWQASLAIAPSTLRSGSGIASARPARTRSRPMVRDEHRAHALQRLDGHDVEAGGEQRLRQPPGAGADVDARAARRAQRRSPGPRAAGSAGGRARRTPRRRGSSLPARRPPAPRIGGARDGRRPAGRPCALSCAGPATRGRGAGRTRCT